MSQGFHTALREERRTLMIEREKDILFGFETRHLTGARCKKQITDYSYKKRFCKELFLLTDMKTEMRLLFAQNIFCYAIMNAVLQMQGLCIIELIKVNWADSLIQPRTTLVNVK